MNEEPGADIQMAVAHDAAGTRGRLTEASPLRPNT
jgi:hypothetical protein